MDVEEWLKGLGLGQYAPAFAENDIDLAVLVQLTEVDLKELGISSLGHRKRLLAAIAEQGMASLACWQDGERDLPIFRDHSAAGTANFPNVAVNFREAL